MRKKLNVNILIKTISSMREPRGHLPSVSQSTLARIAVLNNARFLIAGNPNNNMVFSTRADCNGIVSNLYISTDCAKLS